MKSSRPGQKSTGKKARWTRAQKQEAQRASVRKQARSGSNSGAASRPARNNNTDDDRRSGRRDERSGGWNRADRRGEDRGGRSYGGNRDERGGRGYSRDDRGGRGYDRDDRRQGGNRFGRDDRPQGGRGYDRDDRGGYNRDDRGGRGFNRDDRGGRGYDRDDRRQGGNRFGRDDRPQGGRGYNRDDRGGFSRDDRGGRGYDRDDRRQGGNRFNRDDRGGYNRDDRGGRGFNRDDRGGYNRDDRGGRGFNRDDRGGYNRDDRGGRGFNRDDRGGYNRDDRGGRGFNRDDRRQSGHRFERDDRGGRPQGSSRYDRDDRGYSRDDRRDGNRVERDHRHQDIQHGSDRTETAEQAQTTDQQNTSSNEATMTPPAVETPAVTAPVVEATEDAGTREAAASTEAPAAQSDSTEQGTVDAESKDDQPDVTFADLGLPTELVERLARDGIVTPFPIQVATIPDALEGRDVLGRGRTGSGKTLSFGLPTLARLAAGGKARAHQPRAIVMCPTRELAMQVADALQPLVHVVGLKHKLVAGGMPYEPQLQALERGVDLLVATPGRLQDLMERGAADLSRVEVMILDEADHMAEMGFLEAITEILDAVPSGGQRLLFSATLDRGIDALVEKYLVDPVIHSTDDGTASVATMSHHALLIDPQHKKVVTAEVANRSGRTVVFVRTKLGADRVAGELRSSGVMAAALHGGLNQSQRNKVLSAFKEGRVPVLVATDVAARGIHVDDVGVVLQVDPPADHKDYLHRAGRTARAGESGTVVMLALPHQRRTVQRLLDQAGVGIELTRARPGDEVIAQAGGSTPTDGPVTDDDLYSALRPPRSGRGRDRDQRRGGGGYRSGGHRRDGRGGHGGGGYGGGRRYGGGSRSGGQGGYRNDRSERSDRGGRGGGYRRDDR
ncbi:DEAD/DEAH box helicase [Dermacoccaceae bacterium W4C1]